MLQKRNWVQKKLDNLRTSLMLEPRGHNDMFGAILTDPVTVDSTAGVIFMDTGGYLEMCGHGTIGVATALVETGIIATEESGEQNINLDTPAGQVLARLVIEDKEVKEVTIRNVPSFWYSSETIEVPNLGDVSIDIAYGGNFFALVDVNNLKTTIDLANLSKLIEVGMNIKKRTNNKLKIIHPRTEKEGKVDLVEIYNENLSPPKDIVVFGSGQVDRSPCGSGTSAKMALLYAKGKLNIGEEYRYRSILNTEFRGKLIEQTQIKDYQAVIPEITGKAYITGIQQLIINDDDPFKHGFQLC